MFNRRLSAVLIILAISFGMLLPLYSQAQLGQLSRGGTYYIKFLDPADDGKVFTGDVLIQWRLYRPVGDNTTVTFKVYLGSDSGNLTLQSTMSQDDALFRAPDDYQWGTSALAEGTYTVRIEAYNGTTLLCKMDSPKFQVSKEAVQKITVSIISPTEGSIIPFGQVVDFQGECSETGCTYSWYSSIDHTFGDGQASFQYSGLSPGNHTITFTATKGSITARAQVNITIKAEAVKHYVRITDIVFNRTEIHTGDHVNISINLGNDYAQYINNTIIVKLDGTEIHRENVTVAPESHATVVFDFVFPAEGVHNITAIVQGNEGLTARKSVTVSAPIPIDKIDGKDDASSDRTSGQIMGIDRNFVIGGMVIIILLAVAVVILLLPKKKPRKKKAPSPIQGSQMGLSAPDWEGEAFSSLPTMPPDMDSSRKKSARSKTKDKGKDKNKKSGKNGQIDDELQDIMDEVFR